MNNRVYYGEYSLKHWVNLMLKGNIVLPEYQRIFVWREDQVGRLYESIIAKEFIPPVTIGAYIKDENTYNYIIDGQQRLTSVFLLYLGLFPDKSHKIGIEEIRMNQSINDNDDYIEDKEEEESEVADMLEWRFDKLTQLGKSKEEIMSQIKFNNDYKKLKYSTDDGFFNNNYLGFSYLVPDQTGIKQQKYFSTVFRNINIQGSKLLFQESRKSLYFLNPELKEFFSPKFSEKFRIDFTRYLALIFQYKKDNSEKKVARTYKSYMEDYYEKFIYSVVDEPKESLFENFTQIFPDGDFHSSFTEFESFTRLVPFPISFKSIIDADIYFFGSIYYIILEKKKFNSTPQEFQDEMRTQINTLKNDSSHTKTPGAVSHLRKRIKLSIATQDKFFK